MINNDSAVPTTSIGSLAVSRLGLGCMGMTMAYGRRDPAAARATIARALDRGVTLFDTADMYANGANEKLVGSALKGHRSQAVIATKCGFTTWPLLGLPRGVNGRPEYIRACAEGSLRRLGIDVIDLYYLHRVDPEVPVEESFGAMAELVERGLVREVGISEATADEIRRAHAVHPVAAVQTEWSAVSRDLEEEIVPAAREIGATLVPYSPLGRGMLTADPTALKPGLFDFRRFLPRWSKENIGHNTALAEQVRSIADQHGHTAAQVALAWVLARGDDVVPIPGTSKPHRLDENLGALDVDLTDDDFTVLDGLVAAGARYGSVGG
ncbi:MAG: aldo/keto reductase [Propionibacteriales bacterium]|nr:aldo/keto reductase [Propionibacteriales bacterium]